MKLLCHVLEASDNGDKLKLRLQGKGVNEAEWIGMTIQEMSIPMTDRNRRTFYVGRRVTIDIKPDGRQ